MSLTDRSITLGINIEHGIDFCENTGYWPMPESNDGVVKILDDNNYIHVLVFDFSDGYFYDITTRDGPTGSGLTTLFVDKADTDGTGGYDITPEVTFKEDTGEYDKFVTEHLSSRFGLRPFKESFRNASGYDSNGYPTNIEFTSKIFIDGEPTTETATAEDISKTGEVVYDRKAEGHRLQTVFSADKSGFKLLSRNQTYITKDINNNPDNRITTEGNHQNNLSSPLLWFTRGETPSYDRVNESPISGTFGYTNGPDGKVNSAFSISDTTLTLPNISSTNAKTVSLFATSEPVIQIGGNNISLTNYSTEDGWSLYYASGITYSGSVTVSGGTLNLFDIRVYDGNKSSDLTYYYNDVTDNSGNNICPLY